MIRSFMKLVWAACWLALPIAAATAIAAQEEMAPDEVSADGKPAAESAAIEERLTDLGLAIEGIAESQADGIYEVEVEGGDYIYVTADGRHLLVGNLYELRDGDLVGLTEEKRNTKRRELIKDIPDSQFLTYAPTSDTRASVWVFTDTDCGFCRRLHANLPDYHSFGIEVRYLAYPRAGVESPTYEKMVSAWCADDPLDALTALKQGEDIPSKQCINPVAEQYELGQQVGLTGTPSFVLPSGRMLSGLVDAEQLAEMLGI